MDNRVAKLTTGWNEEPFSLSFENCVPPVVDISGRHILDLIPDTRGKQRLFCSSYRADSIFYGSDKPVPLVEAAQEPLPIPRIKQQVVFFR